MARHPLTAGEVRAFRERATRAATHLFALHGFEGVTLRSLAQALRCSPMTPYRYFENKDDLFAAVRTEAFRRFADAQAAAALRPGSTRERLRRLGAAYVAFALAEPDAYRIMFELGQSPAGVYPELDAEVRRSFSCLLGVTEALVAERQEGGDALTLAHLSWAEVHGLVSLHLAGKLTVGRSLEALAAHLFGAPTKRRKS
jgi:AcrR family transcriptional regulator